MFPSYRSNARSGSLITDSGILLMCVQSIGLLAAERHVASRVGVLSATTEVNVRFRAESSPQRPTAKGGEVRYVYVVSYTTELPVSSITDMYSVYKNHTLAFHM